MGPTAFGGATDSLLEYQRRFSLDPGDTEAVKHLTNAARDSWYWQAVELIRTGFPGG